MPRLLLWSDSACASTGFGRVARTICNALSEDWEIVQVGLNHPGRLVEHDRIKIHAAPSDDPTGFLIAKELYMTQDFDLLLVIQDLHITSAWASAFSSMRASRKLRNKKRIPVVYHFPVDGPMLGDVEFSKFADYNVSCTQWGVDILQPLLPDAKIDVIPHAVDTSVYKALPEKERKELRRGIYGIDSTDETLAILSLGVNTDRKDHFTALCAVKELNREQVQGKIYFHTKAAAHGMDLYCQSRSAEVSPLEYRIADSSLLGCSDEALNKLYNASDCLLFTSRREGFGIPMIEAIAAGVPVLAPDYGPFREVLAEGDFGYLHKPVGKVWVRGDNRGYGWQSGGDVVARHLQFLSSAKKEAWDGPAEKIEVARMHVEQSYSLESVTPLWREYIKEALDGS